MRQQSIFLKSERYSVPRLTLMIRDSSSSSSSRIKGTLLQSMVTVNPIWIMTPTTTRWRDDKWIIVQSERGKRSKKKKCQTTVPNLSSVFPPTLTLEDEDHHHHYHHLGQLVDFQLLFFSIGEGGGGGQLTSSFTEWYDV